MMSILLQILLLSVGEIRAWTTLPQSQLFRSQKKIYDICQHSSQHYTHHLTHIFSSTTSSTREDITSILDDIDEKSLPLLRLGKRVGSGSYGTVHQGYLIQTKNDIKPCIAKRAWSLSEIESGVPTQIFNLDQEEDNLAVAQRTGLATQQTNGDTTVSIPAEEISSFKTRGSRCEHYWNVERHCFQKIKVYNENIKDENKKILATPEFYGVHQDDGNEDQLLLDVEGYGLSGSSKGHQWMTFEFVGSTSDGNEDKPAQTLLDAMELDWKDQHTSGQDNHHLYDIQTALNLPETSSFGDTLDAIFISLLENLKELHDCIIVHRDLKPGNLLCDPTNQRLRLIDLGSAADIEPSPWPGIPFAQQRVGYDEGIASVSPVYCAPETFIKLNEKPMNFDVFSAALIMCQLLFNLLDERTDAGFLQQIKEVDYDLDTWLEKELGTKLRFGGFDDGLEYLGARRGLWSLLKQMFEVDPNKRITSYDAVEKLEKIMGLKSGDVEWSESLMKEVAQNEAYFESVIESFESCSFDLTGSMPRPLAFLASFEKGKPVGLLLAEASEVENDGSMSTDEWEKWQSGTDMALPGEVFVRGWENGSQAEQLGLFEVGDRLRGVGELPFVDQGFDQAVNLISRQPKSGSLTLHFDRISTPKSQPKSDQVKSSNSYTVTGQGAWKSGGRRGAQEDAFVLHEIKNDEMGDILLAGVFDGHAGTAASKTCASILPPLFTTELMGTSGTIGDALENAWETTCNTYRGGCDENGECIVDYDPREGILFADTGSKDLVGESLVAAGTTATCAAIKMNPDGTNELNVLNCGDSRTLLVGQPISSDLGDSVVVFETRDHSPDDEIEIQRLTKGKEEGRDYSIPECSMTSGSYMRVGDFQYALCRSLEGSFVTEKGIVSDPDMTTLNLASSLADRQNCALVLACDGLFEVMSNEEVGREVIRMRGEGYAAGDIAKNLCGQALKKFSYDNLSVVVVFLDEA